MRRALILVVLIAALAGWTVAGTAAKGAAGSPTIIAAGSEFGRMLFDSHRRAIYVFGRDGKGPSRCYNACAAAWPVVYSSGKPKAGPGVRADLLGTIRRKDGRSQATYAGRPLYYYAHEKPGQVLCHDVDLNGGIWKVVAPDGRPRK